MSNVFRKAVLAAAHLTAVAALAAGAAAANQEDPAAVRVIPGTGSYAVLVSAETYAQKEWKEVVQALCGKHNAAVIVYPHSIWEARRALAGLMPRYACFVVRPNQAGRTFVVSVHRMTRTLDRDPYTDVLWGILTGYEAKDALRIARYGKPLIVRRAAAGCNCLNLKPFDEGVVYSEVTRGLMFQKLPGKATVKKKCPPDTTQALANVLNTYKPDVFVTSGHATERDWQIGYSYKNGQFRCRSGQLLGLDLKRKVYKIHSPNPKVYLAAGNCLTGHIPDRWSMALAWMRSAGAYQMVGYVISTWFDYSGWGTNKLFFGQPGRYTLAEAFYLNNQALVHRLVSRHPSKVKVDFQRWNVETDRRLMVKLARKFKLRGNKLVGLLWDRDTFVLYGDPAWPARLKKQDLAWRQSLTEKGGLYTFQVTTNRKGKWRDRPLMTLLGHRIGNVEVIEGKDLQPVITDNFILLPMTGPFEKGQTVQVVFKAKRI